MARDPDPTPVRIRREGDERVVRADKVLPSDFIVATDEEVTEMRNRIHVLEGALVWGAGVADTLQAEVDRLTAELAECRGVAQPLTPVAVPSRRKKGSPDAA